MRYIFDIDDTICQNSEIGKYEKATPKKEMIVWLKKLYEEGNEIIICTGRGSVTGIDQEELTKKQLKDWGVKYHKLIFVKKPRAYLYVDDKCCTPEEFLERMKNNG